MGGVKHLNANEAPIICSLSFHTNKSNYESVAAKQEVNTRHIYVHTHIHIQTVKHSNVLSIAFICITAYNVHLYIICFILIYGTEEPSQLKLSSSLSHICLVVQCVLLDKTVVLLLLVPSVLNGSIGSHGSCSPIGCFGSVRSVGPNSSISSIAALVLLVTLVLFVQ